jgi:hypothetical protein
VVRIREMPVSTDDNATTICIGCMVAHRPHAFSLAPLENVVAVHDTLHWCSNKIVTIPFMRILEALPTLHAECVAITVPVAAHPLVTSASVHQGTMAMPAGVEEGAFTLFHWHFVAAVMRRMREMPRATHHAALAIGVARIIAHWSQFLRSARLVDVSSSHVACDLDADEFVVVVCERHFESIVPHTKCLSIFVVAIRPAMRVARVHQGTVAIGTAAVCVETLHEPIRETAAFGVVRIRHVPVAANNHAAPIGIAGIIAHRPHTLLLARLVNLIALHATFDLHAVNHVASCSAPTGPFELHLEPGATLHTECVAITVPVAVHPLVTSASVQQGAMAMPASVEECTFTLFVRHLVPLVMRRMREVPPATHHAALAI